MVYGESALVFGHWWQLRRHQAYHAPVLVMEIWLVSVNRWLVTNNNRIDLNWPLVSLVWANRRLEAVKE